jgi:1,4-alpha-glucan branching enzyme
MRLQAASGASSDSQMKQHFDDLNGASRRELALHEADTDPRGFEWIDGSDVDNSVVTWLRRGRAADASASWVAVACNFTPIPRMAYGVGVPRGGRWDEILNGDATVYGGSGLGNLGGVDAEEIPCHGRPWRLSLVLPPLAMIVLRSHPPGGAAQDLAPGSDA